MSRFAYSGSQDSAEKVITGVVEAPTRQEALNMLAKRSIRVARLEMVAPSGALKTLSGASNTPSGASKAPLPQVKVVLPVQPAGKSHDQSIIIGASLLILLGLAYVCFGTKPGPSVKAGQQSSTCHVHISGHLSWPDNVNASDVQARVHLPEIPLDEFRAGKELLSTDGTFKLDFEFRSPKPPTTFSFMAQANHAGQLELHHLPLTSQADGTLTCTLDNLRLPAPSQQSSRSANPVKNARPRQLPPAPPPRIVPDGQAQLDGSQSLRDKGLAR